MRYTPFLKKGQIKKIPTQGRDFLFGGEERILPRGVRPLRTG
jgi:hypothetical protein